MGRSGFPSPSDAPARPPRSPSRVTWSLAETPTAREACFRLRAAAYGRLYRNVPADVFRDPIDDAVLADGRPQSSLVLAEGVGGPVGTMRVAVVRHPAHPALRSEVDGLMEYDPRELTAGLRRAGVRDPAGVPLGELGRMAIARGDVPAAMRATLEGVAWAALAAGLPALVWIMAPFVERRFRALGVRAARVGGARLRRETRDQLAYLLTYHDYFLPALGGRGLDVDPAGLARGGSLEGLRALVGDCPDGTDLYCMRSDAFAAGLDQVPAPAAGEGEAG